MWFLCEFNEMRWELSWGAERGVLPAFLQSSKQNKRHKLNNNTKIQIKLSKKQTKNGTRDNAWVIFNVCVTIVVFIRFWAEP